MQNSCITSSASNRTHDGFASRLGDHLRVLLVLLVREEEEQMAFQHRLALEVDLEVLLEACLRRRVSEVMGPR